MVMPSLAKFIAQVPCCEEHASLRSLLTQCDTAESTLTQAYCVILRANHQPIGYVEIVRIFTQMCHHPSASLSLGNRLGHEAPDLSLSLGMADLALRQAIPHLIEPLHVLSAQTPLSQAWVALRQRKVWGLIDAQNHYLGLLDYWAVLRFLADQAHTCPQFFQLPQYGGHAQPGTFAQPGALPEAESTTSRAVDSGTVWTILQTAFADSHLPMMLQSSAGEILSRNLAWEKYLGTWQPWQSAAASDSGTALAVSIAHQDALAMGGSGGDNRLQTHFDIRRTQVCDVEQRCGQWEIMRIPIQSSAFTGLPQVTLAASSETIWLCLGQPYIAIQPPGSQPGSQGQSFDLKDQLLGCLNHELKGAITSLLGLSKLLLDNRVGHLDDRQTRYVQLIHHNSQNLKTTVNEILDVTRAASGQMLLMPAPVALDALVQAALAEAKAYNRLRHKLEAVSPSSDVNPQDLNQQDLNQQDFNQQDLNQQLTCEIQPGLETLFVDELRLRQMLGHLLSNALKYTPDPGHVGIVAQRWSEWIALTVWDTGCGIAAKQQPLVFHRLQWQDSLVASSFSGPGVGLLLIRQLARLQGGELTFQSTPGQGSRFTVLLPYRSHKQMRVGNVNVRSSQHSRFVVLAAMALDIAMVDRIAEHLQSLGYYLAIARSNEETVDKTLMLHPYAVLLWATQDVSQDTLMQCLAQHDAIAKIPVIDVSACYQPDNSDLPVDPLLDQAIDQERSRHRLDQLLKRQAMTNSRHSDRDERPQLVVLYLKPPSQLRTPEDANDLSLLLQRYGCRILEVDDIEQADLLVHIWKPQVVLIDPKLDHNPMTSFQQISHQPRLATLPLVTLTGKMTQAANSFSNLAVYPYLAPLDLTILEKTETPPLIDVLKIAAAQGG